VIGLRRPYAMQSTSFASLAGGLMSYGGSRKDQYRLVGIYAGRILRRQKASRPSGATRDPV
jgi:hypothetical protein